MVFDPSEDSMESLDIKELERLALKELQPKTRLRPACSEIYRRAITEFDESASRIFYSIWYPIIKNWAFQMSFGSRMDLEDIANNTLLILFQNAKQENFFYTTPGELHNYLKKTCMNLIFASREIRAGKMRIIKATKKVLKNLEDIEKQHVQKEILPLIEAQYGSDEKEMILAVINGFKPREILELEPFLEKFSGSNNPNKDLHNWQQTTLWHFYRFLRSNINSEIKICKKLYEIIEHKKILY